MLCGVHTVCGKLHIATQNSDYNNIKKIPIENIYFIACKVQFSVNDVYNCNIYTLTIHVLLVFKHSRWASRRTYLLVHNAMIWAVYTVHVLIDFPYNGCLDACDTLLIECRRCLQYFPIMNHEQELYHVHVLYKQLHIYQRE